MQKTCKLKYYTPNNKMLRLICDITLEEEEPTRND